MISPERLTELFVEVADTLVAGFDLIEFLHDLTGHAADVSGAGAVGIVLADHHGRLQYMAASNESGETLELLQLQADEGPCLDCFRERAPVSSTDLGRAQDRWPHFAPRARDAGFRSVHAFPMRLREEVIGALNIFGTQPLQFADNEVRIVQSLADVATIGLLQQRQVARAEALTEQLQAALNTRILIEQAKGALAQREHISPDQAFTRMRAQARHERRPLTEIATAVLGLEHPG